MPSNNMKRNMTNNMINLNKKMLALLKKMEKEYKRFNNLINPLKDPKDSTDC